MLNFSLNAPLENWKKKKKISVQDVHKHQYHRTLATSTLIISFPEKIKLLIYIF
jgi:hypothetical protein